MTFSQKEKQQKNINQDRSLPFLRKEETTKGYQSKPVLAPPQREKPQKLISKNCCLLGLRSPLRPNRKRAPLQMERRQKDVSQNRWLHLLKGSSFKSSAVEAGVGFDFTPPLRPSRKRAPLQMQKRQKDISQNRWLHPLRGKNQKKFCSRSCCWLGLYSPLRPSRKKGASPDGEATEGHQSKPVVAPS